MSARFDLQGFAAAVGEKRKALGLSQSEVAIKAGIDGDSVEKLEKGWWLYLDQTVALCEWLGVPIDSFVRRDTK